MPERIDRKATATAMAKCIAYLNLEEPRWRTALYWFVQLAILLDMEDTIKDEYKG